MLEQYTVILDKIRSILIQFFFYLNNPSNDGYVDIIIYRLPTGYIPPFMTKCNDKDKHCYLE